MYCFYQKESKQVFVKLNNLSVRCHFLGELYIEFLAQANVFVSRFCHHPRLELAGNCRMCFLYDMVNRKLFLGCTTNVIATDQVDTYGTMVSFAREGVMAFLLLNHPLDCAICDQGGECDLQDLSYRVGNDISFFSVGKRNVMDAFLNGVLKFLLSRCIYCTRCVRMANRLYLSSFGMIGRGYLSNITSYVKTWSSRGLSSHLVEVCPVSYLKTSMYISSNIYSVLSIYTYILK